MTLQIPHPKWAITLLTAGTVALAANPARAQHLSFDVGPLAGVAIGSWRGSDVRGPGFRTSFVGGAFATIAINQYFSLEPQILYVRKGTTLAGPPPDVTYTQNYVEIPLLITGKYPLAGSMHFAPTIFAGPAVAFQTSCSFSSGGGTFPGGAYVPQNGVRCDSLLSGTGASMRHTDALVVFGGGFNFGSFGLLVRYDLGLTKLIVTNSGARQDVKTEAWLMSAGFRLRLGKK
jgi:hypothetical protein